MIEPPQPPPKEARPQSERAARAARAARLRDEIGLTSAELAVLYVSALRGAGATPTPTDVTTVKRWFARAGGPTDAGLVFLEMLARARRAGLNAGEGEPE